MNFLGHYIRTGVSSLTKSPFHFSSIRVSKARLRNRFRASTRLVVADVLRVPVQIAMGAGQIFNAISYISCLIRTKCPA